MPTEEYGFQPPKRISLPFTSGDLLAFLFIVVALFIGARLAFGTPLLIPGPKISLSPSALPLYTLLSLGRMTAAYALSILFTLLYGRAAAYSHRAERLLMPLLDVLQSVPILSFLPVVLLSLSAVLPEKIATELASIVLIFTSMAWNLTFAWYQSLTTIPKELREASSIFRLNGWMKFKRLELPFGMIALVWNSMVSWAGGWFFLMAAETYTVGARDFRLPGLGSYLSEAASQENYRAVTWGLLTLVVVIVFLDQLVWRPLNAWSNRFKVEMVEDDQPPTSWFFAAVGNSRLLNWIGSAILRPVNERFDGLLLRRFPMRGKSAEKRPDRIWLTIILWVLFALVVILGIWYAGGMLRALPLAAWGEIGLGLAATLLRVVIALIIALAWTVPVGVAVGTNRKLATFLQPVIQVTASIPATALFPVILLFVLGGSRGGLNMAAILLMLLGTQWYLLFNIIAGTSAIPQDLRFTSALLQIKGWRRWNTLILPAIFPYLVTGLITASGGAWNASIVAEYQKFGGQTYYVTGVGSLIARATAVGDYPLLLATTLSMVVTVILINRLLWRRLYLLAEEKYRME